MAAPNTDMAILLNNLSINPMHNIYYTEHNSAFHTSKSIYEQYSLQNIITKISKHTDSLLYMSVLSVFVLNHFSKSIDFMYIHYLV